MSSTIISAIINDGYKISLFVFFTILSYKFYRSRYTIDSDCCKHAFRLHTQNDGNGEIELGNVIQGVVSA